MEEGKRQSPRALIARRSVSTVYLYLLPPTKALDLGPSLALQLKTTVLVPSTCHLELAPHDLVSLQTKVDRKQKLQISSALRIVINHVAV